MLSLNLRMLALGCVRRVSRRARRRLSDLLACKILWIKCAL